MRDVADETYFGTDWPDADASAKAPPPTAQKYDAGKPRYDLFPWADVAVADDAPSVAVALASLQIWWTGKPFRFTLSVPRQAVPGIVAVLSFGASKYRPRGWEDGIEYSRVFAAACRHAYADAAGELLDAETGLPHASHFWCNVVFLATFAQRGSYGEFDDRPAPSPRTVEMLDRMRAFVAQTTGQSAVSAAGLADDGRKSN